MIPKIKLSEDRVKITNPGDKQVYRFYDKNTGKIKGDIIGFTSEEYNEGQNTVLFDPVDTWKRQSYYLVLIL